MRMMEEFARVFAKVFFLRDTKQYAYAHMEVDNVSRMITGFTPNQLKALGPEGVRNVFDYKESNIEKIYYTARIVMEDAFLFELEGKIDESLENYAFALALFEHLKNRGFAGDNDMLNDISFIRKKIN
jgi:hypothetical protein